MKSKIKIILIFVAFLVCILFVARSFIEKENPQITSLAEISDKIEENIAKSTGVFKDETPKILDVENKIEDTEVVTSINKLNFKHNDKGIPVLMYHSIEYEKGNTARLPKEKFKEQMKYLKENNYTTLSLEEAYDFFISNKPIPEKAVVLTFDDGYVDNYVEAFPILKELEFKATFFVITDLVDKIPSYMNLVQLKELQASGMDIESHTVNHEHLNQLSYENQVKTLKESKDFLEKSLNKKIQYFAYPYGEFTEETLTAVKETGYKMAFTTAGRWSDKTDGILTLDRVFISGAANLDVFIERITNANY